MTLPNNTVAKGIRRVTIADDTASKTFQIANSADDTAGCHNRVLDGVYSLSRHSLLSFRIVRAIQSFTRLVAAALMGRPDATAGC